MNNNFNRRRNGTGSVVFLGKGRYKPYAARLLIGKNENGIPIYFDIDTFETYLDALICLENWIKNPYPLKVDSYKYNRIFTFTCLPGTDTPYPLVPVENKSSMIHRKDTTLYTFKQIFDEMRENLFPNAEERELEKKYHIKPKNKYALHNSNNMITAFHNSVGLYDKIYSELITSDFRDYLTNCGKNESSKNAMIKLYKNMDNYAFSIKTITIKYAHELKTTVNDDINSKSARSPFSYEQIKYLWNIKSENKKDEFVRDFLLLANYTGARADELLSIYTKNVYLDKNYFIAGIKTENAINRQIPIHPLVKPIFEKYYDPNNEFLFMKENGNRLFYADYNNYYNNKFIDKHEFIKGKTAHCGRHGLETELQKLNVKPTIINSIIGHKNGNTGDDIYNHISIEEKLKAIKLVTFKPGKIYVLKNERKTS